METGRTKNMMPPLPLLRLGAGVFLVLLVVFVSITRIQFESRLNQVMLAADYSDIRDFSLYYGHPVEQLLGDLETAGFTAVIIHEDTLATALEDGRLRQLPGTKTFPTRLITTDRNLAERITAVLKARFFPDCVRHTAAADGELIELALSIDLEIQQNQTADVKPWALRKRIGIGYPHAVVEKLRQRGFTLLAHYVTRPGEEPGTMESIINEPPWNQDELPLINSGNAVPSTRRVKRLMHTAGVRPVEVEFGTTPGWGRIKRSLKPGTVLKAHLVSREIIDKNPPRRIQHRLARAARERRATILCPRMRFRTQTAKDPWPENLELLKRTRKLLQEQGMRVSNRLPRISTFSPLTFPLVVIPTLAILLIAGPSIIALAGFFIIVGLVILLLPPSVQLNQVIAFWTALFFPTAAILRFWPVNAERDGPESRTDILVRAIRSFLGATGFTLFGALVTAALLTTPDILFGASLFRGVKAAFLLPPFLVAVNLLFRDTHPLRWLRRVVSERLTLIHLLIVFLLIAGTVLYLTRSGNEPIIQAGSLERDIRDWLETTLIARPRTKEMLLGHPAFILGAALLIRRKGRKLILLAMLAAVGQVSLFNTFCHLQTPLSYSILRSINGLLIGIPAGLALAWAALVFGWGKLRPRVLLAGYFGKGNLGDDLLLAGEICALRKADPTLDIEVLSGTPDKTSYKFNLDAVKRSNPFKVLAALIRADALISGGGGLLQDTTSRISLYYYLGLSRLARIFGKADIHWGIGLGPFQNTTTARKTAEELAAADLVFLRDERSVNWVARPNFPTARIETGNDLAFALADMLPPPCPPADKRPYTLALSIRPGRLFDAVRHDLVKSLAFLLQETIDRIIVMPFDRRHDGVISDEVAGEVRTLAHEVNASAGFTGRNVTVLETPLTLEQAIETIDTVHVVLGMRLHSLILACLRGRPFIGLPYDPKVSSFIETLQLPDAGLTMRTVTPALLEKAVRTCIAGREAAFQRLTEASIRRGTAILGEADLIVKCIRSHYAVRSSQAI